MSLPIERQLRDQIAVNQTFGFSEARLFAPDRLRNVAVVAITVLRIAGRPEFLRDQEPAREDGPCSALSLKLQKRGRTRMSILGAVIHKQLRLPSESALEGLLTA